MRECQLKTPSFHCSHYHAEASCAHSRGLVRHEDWGITTNERVLFYAFAAAHEPGDWASATVLSRPLWD